MNHNDLPDDELLQLLFGELDESRQIAMRKVIAEDAELAATLQGLAAAVAAVRAENVGQLSDDFNDRLRRRMSEAIEPEQAVTARPTFLTRSRSTWRWIMRSPVSRVAAAAILVLTIGGVALWFHGGGTAPAFADFLQPILDAKTVKFKATTQWTSLPPELKALPAETLKDCMTFEVMMLDAYRSREEMGKGKSKMVMISDMGRGKSITLQPAEKQATVTNYADAPKGKTPRGGDPVAGFRSLLLDARSKPDVKRESLGEKVLDGRRVVGVRISLPAAVMCVWGDPKTGTPVRIESTMTLMPNMKVTMSDFAFNVKMDESLFSVEPPTGYEVIVVKGHTRDDAPGKEKDLIEMFRCYNEVSGGRFPDLLDILWLRRTVSMQEWCAANLAGSHKSMAQRQQEQQQREAKFQRGMMFTVTLPKEADWHYAGRGVSLGAADRPIFWYRPKGAKKYRVIYAALAVREADSPPRVPVATDVQLEKDLIEMFRLYGELSGGPLPVSIDMSPLLMVVHAKEVSFTSSEKPQKLSAKQKQELAQTLAELLRGVIFTGLLPEEADWHYAGRRVSLGAANKPIFWYRPKDSKQYRVIYADLSVHEAQTPPSAPVVQPEQDLIDMFRDYSELSGGPFPISLEIAELSSAVCMKIYSKFPPKERRWSDAKLTQEVGKTMMKFQPSFNFTFTLPKEADWHYAGRGVSLGAAGKPIFWYRPTDAKKYRVIYADLSVRDADTPPNVPNAQRPVQPKQVVH
jgi:hypothetical protein